MQDMTQLIKQKEESKDFQLKQTVVDLTRSFEAENTKTTRKFEAEIAETIIKFKAEAAARAQSSAEVRLTKILVLASAGFHSCWDCWDHAQPCYIM